MDFLLFVGLVAISFILLNRLSKVERRLGQLEDLDLEVDRLKRLLRQREGEAPAVSPPREAAARAAPTAQPLTEEAPAEEGPAEEAAARGPEAPRPQPSPRPATEVTASPPPLAAASARTPTVTEPTTGPDRETRPEPPKTPPATPPLRSDTSSQVDRPEPPRPPRPVPKVMERADRSRSSPLAAAFERWRRGLSFEELLAGQVFLRIGVATVVLGVAFFLGWAVKEYGSRMGPAGRITLGYLGGLAMLAGGLWSERKEDYRTFGRALVAGGWAILYFVTFAMHFLPAAQVVTSRPLGIFALLVAGGATVAFSLRYRNEWTTLASFLLIFLALFTAAVQLDAVFNLAATTVVAVALAALSWRLGWHRLLGLGAPATWAVVVVWLIPATLAGTPAAASPWVLLGVATIWLALQMPVLAQPKAVTSRNADLWHTVVVLAGLVGVALTVFWVHTHANAEAWLAPLVFGVLYLGGGWRLSRTARRQLYLLSATTALLLLAVAPALYLGLTSRWLTLFWVLEVELVLAAGAFLRERYFRYVAYLGFLALAADLLAARLSPLLPGGAEAVANARLPLLGATVLVGLLDVYLLRGPWRPLLSQAEQPTAARGFSLLASGLLLILLWQEMPELWLAPVLAAVALVWTVVAARFGLRDFLWEAGGWAVFGLLTSAVRNLPPDPSLSRVEATGPLALSALALVPAWVLLRRTRTERLPASASRRVAIFFSAVATFLLVSLVLQALPDGVDPWQAAVLLALGTCYLALALRTGWRELFVEGCALGAVGLAAGLAVSWQSIGSLGGISLRTLSLLAALVPLYLSYLLLIRSRSERIPKTWVSAAATAHSAAATAVLIALVFHAVGTPWQAVTLLALAALHLALALRWRRGELFLEGGALSLAGLGAVALGCWQLEGFLLGLPARTTSVLAALVPLYGIELLLRRYARADRGEGGRRLFTFLDRRSLASVATGYLAAASLVAAALVKAEALAFGKNLFVALVWGLMGAAYLEIGRQRSSPAWHLQGHALVAAGAVHLFLVNFLQPGFVVGALSWRLVTVLPFFALMAWVYLTWDGAAARLGLPERVRRLRPAYLYGMETVLAVLVLYELQRSWVTAAWAALGLGSLLLWRAGGNLHWRLAGSVLAVAAMVRGFEVNLYLRDEIWSQRLNLTVLPLACVLLLAGYLVIRQHQLQTAIEKKEEGAPDWRHWLQEGVRLAWLFSLLGLLNAFLWVEATGTLLTVWWSLEGLALVALGFLLHERLARQLGLAALSFCVLKLFFYDLRGLEGLMRILSFIVLGLVLIAVSFAYTRFRERWKQLW